MTDSGRTPLRVCYISSIIAKEQAGTEGHLIRLVRSLSRARFQPQLVSLQDSDLIDHWKDPHVPLRAVGYRALYRPLDWLKLWNFSKWLRKDRYQIVELHSPEAQFVGGLAARLAGVPRIIACRRSLGYNFDRKAKLQLALTNRMVDGFLANSQAVIDQRSQQEGIAKQRFTLIPNGIDLVQFDRDRRNPCGAVFEEASRDALLIAIAANLRPVKNHAMLLQAAQLVLDQSNTVRFVLLGTGEEEVALRQQAEALGISDRVLFLGSKSPVAPFLDRSDIGCLSSDSEGLSNAILEYMAAELPVVATDVGGTAEAVVDGDTGFLVPPRDVHALADRLMRLIRDETLRCSLGRQGRQRVESNFSMQRQLSAYAQFYETLLEKPRNA